MFRDGMQVGILYATVRGIHVVSGNALVRLFEETGRIGDRDLIVHQEDEDGDSFFELSKPVESQSQADGMVERLLVDKGYDISPARF